MYRYYESGFYKRLPCTAIHRVMRCKIAGYLFNVGKSSRQTLKRLTTRQHRFLKSFLIPKTCLIDSIRQRSCDSAHPFTNFSDIDISLKIVCIIQINYKKTVNMNTSPLNASHEDIWRLTVKIIDIIPTISMTMDEHPPL